MRARFVRRLVRFYTKYNQDKLQDVGDVATEWAGQEQEAMAALCDKYEVNPSEEAKETADAEAKFAAQEEGDKRRAADTRALKRAEHAAATAAAMTVSALERILRRPRGIQRVMGGSYWGLWDALAHQPLSSVQHMAKKIK